jgi:hypothetical protein
MFLEYFQNKVFLMYYALEHSTDVRRIICIVEMFPYMGYYIQM